MKKNIQRFAINYFSRSRYRLAKLKNIHLNRRAFIVGTGPSLCVSDLDKLKNEVTFGCNKIYLAFAETDWRPTYYSVIDRIVAENNKNEIEQLALTKIFSSVTKPFFKKSKDVIWLNDLNRQRSRVKENFNFQPTSPRESMAGLRLFTLSYNWHTIWGLTEVYLMGIDFDFTESKRTGEKTSAGEEILKSEGEVNHFHRDYRQSGELWTIPRLDYQYKAFQVAKIAFEEDNRCIYNASRRTKLDVFPIVDLDQII